jgi:hypothetical protein
MRIPNTAHTSRPWRIHELTPDFRLEDVWALPTPGGPGHLPRLVEQITSSEPFRYVILYPPLMRRIERHWHANLPSAAWAGAPA